VDSEAGVGRYSSLALNGAGYPHISYFDETNYHLLYAWLMPPPLSLNKRATPTDGLRNDDTLTYALILSGAGRSVRLWDPLPAGVHYLPGSVTGTVTPAAIYSPTVNAVLWQGTLPADMTAGIGFQVTPGITGTGSLSLAPPIVNTAWLTDTVYGRSVWSTVIVNGRHAYMPLLMRQSP
jgi:hypothetical protein